MHIGARFRELRAEKKLTHDQIGAATGRARQAVQRFESSPTASTDMLEILIEPLGVSLPEFFQSRVPKAFADAGHREIHERIQYILERGGDRAIAIGICTEELYFRALDAAAAEIKRTSASGRRDIPPESLPAAERKHHGRFAGKREAGAGDTVRTRDPR